MGIKKKINNYTKELRIPEADKVLPEECRDAKVEKSLNFGKWAKWGGSGALVACGALAVFFAFNGAGSPINKNTDAEFNGLAYESTTGGYGSTGGSGMSTSDSAVETDKKPSRGDSLINNSVAKDDATTDSKGETDKIDTSVDCTEDEYYEEGSQGNVTAGMLTGGELRDNKNWDNWLSIINKPYLESWKLLCNQRYRVYVGNGNEALNNVTVRLLSGEKVIYTAKTAADGYAYLYYNYETGASANPDKVEVMQADGTFAAYDIAQLANSENEIEIKMDGANSAIKVDLMFVVDTTGSMADELEFLKVEIEDVITRSAKEANVDIRTSVNFYRDEGDDYVVKSNDFTSDIDSIKSILKKERVNGGGDWEEAVDQALDNAINGHSWDGEASVKLMFLVLDAPPHDYDDIPENIKTYIEKAAAEGIRIIPVASSGTDAATQQLLRAYAMMTGGTFVFLDNKSGIGGHHEVTVKDDEYTSEYLNDMMIRIICEYCGVSKDKTKVDEGNNPEPNPNNQQQ